MNLILVWGAFALNMFFAFWNLYGLIKNHRTAKRLGLLSDRLCEITPKREIEGELDETR